MDTGVPAQPGGDSIALEFTGRAGEYFRIWIVNVCLSVLTLGIYSAWAKVRRRRYFYGNTLLDGAALDYLADPRAILKGRLIVLAAWVVLVLVQDLGLSGLVIGFIYVVLLPELIVRAQRFNAVNSAYRGVRFRFGAGFAPGGNRRWLLSPGYRETSQFLILPVFLVPLSLGLLYPYYAFRKRQFFLEHSAYGTRSFSFDARPGAFYWAYAKAAMLFLLFLTGSIATLGIAALPLYILFAAYRDAALGRLVWNHTGLGPLRFDCRWSTWGLFKLHFLNSLAILLTIGLLVPWAAIRTAHYEVRGLSLRHAGEAGRFVAAAREQQVGAAGDEAGDFLGLDFGL